MKQAERDRKPALLGGSSGSVDHKVRSRSANLIIAGTTRAASTSLFNYLAAHPDVCPSTLKETRFFLDLDYPLPRAHSYTEGIDIYRQFFLQCDPSALQMEATPDYLYAKGTAPRIRTSLQSVRLVFVLREPIARLVSWYRFAKQYGMIPSTMSLEEYVDEQEVSDSTTQTVPQHLRTLAQGRYSHYLRHYYRHFDPADILVLKSEDLATAPLAQLRRVCDFAGLKADFYEEFSFLNLNQSEAVRSGAFQRWILRSGRYLRLKVHNRPIARKSLRTIWHTLRPVVRRLNTATAQPVAIPDYVLQHLQDYYKDEPRELADLLHAEKWSWS